MRKKSFKTPPFVVWRVEDCEINGRFHYRLVPHGVFGSILLHAALQWFVVVLFIFSNYAKTAASFAILAAVSFVAFTFLAGVSNVIMLRLLNVRSIQPVAALLQRCPKRAAEIYNEVFPTVCVRNPSGRSDLPGATTTGQMAEHVPPSRSRPWIITLHTAYYFVSKMFSLIADNSRYFFSRNIIKAYQLLFYRPHAEKLEENLNRLRALTLRREDSPLHAFTEFAVLSCFVPFTRRAGTTIPPVEFRFIFVYFAPVLFGFTLCLITFCLFVLKTTSLGEYAGLSKKSHFFYEDKFAFMACVFVWFVQSAIYAIGTLERDFKQLSYRYFERQRFPKSMTQFASDVIDRAPDLADAARNHWAKPVITAGIVVLTELYASFLHNLGH
jgi:hypothetical protein